MKKTMYTAKHLFCVALLAVGINQGINFTVPKIFDMYSSYKEYKMQKNMEDAYEYNTGIKSDKKLWFKMYSHYGETLGSIVDDINNYRDVKESYFDFAVDNGMTKWENNYRVIAVKKNEELPEDLSFFVHMKVSEMLKYQNDHEYRQMDKIGEELPDKK